MSLQPIAREITQSTTQPIHYPETDGQPMAESDFQRTPMSYAIDALRHHFRARQDVYVSGNLLLYYEEGNPAAAVAPDCFVVFGIAKYDRRIYKLWEEGKVPDFVLEITSKKTAEYDQRDKPKLYAKLGIAEYWQYDPTGDYLNPILQGNRLTPQGYVPIPRAHPFGHDYGLPSRVLGLDLWVRCDELRFFDPAGQVWLLNYREIDEERLDFARQAEHERQRAEQERLQAEQERRRAEQADRRAEQERQRAEQAEAEKAHFLALLKQAGLDPEQMRASSAG